MSLVAHTVYKTIFVSLFHLQVHHIAKMGPKALAYWQCNTQLPTSNIGQKKMKKMNIKQCWKK
jgi:hypothetical protein